MIEGLKEVPLRATIEGLKFRLRGEASNKLTVYIGSKLRRRIKGYKPNGWCKIYHKGSSLVVMVIYVSDGKSRKLRENVFSLPYSVVSKYWRDGKRGIETPAIVEKDNLVIVDLRDLN